MNIKGTNLGPAASQRIPLAKLGKLCGRQLEDDGWLGPIVTVPEPLRLDAYMNEARPRQTFASVGECPEVEHLDRLEFAAPGPVGNALILHRPLFTVQQAADDEGEAGVPGEIVCLAAALERVKDNLKVIGDGNADHGGLSTTPRSGRSLDRESMGPKELKKCRASHLTP